VRRHYTHGSLETAILAPLAETPAVTIDELIDRLAIIDEFHIGGRDATVHLADQLDIAPEQRVLDVGCGLGGTARLLATRYECRVIGVDVTPEFVAVGTRLNARVGLENRIELHVGSATSVPFPGASFDRATMIHVGMNVPDIQELCCHVGRAVKSWGIFGVYDVMRTSSEPLGYPVPWAQGAAGSFVHRPEEYRTALRRAGFDVIVETNRRGFALEFLRRMTNGVTIAGQSPLGLHILMGADAAAKMANMIDNVQRGAVAPIELIARRH
jgi:ubiquinone/menaquinone biosynthesis C-methylase UbiE